MFVCVCVCVRALFPGDLCAADGAYVVSFNDGGPSPGEARRRSILCSVYAQSAHQRDTNVGQRKGNAADSSHSREQGERRRKKKKKETHRSGYLGLNTNLAELKQRWFESRSHSEVKQRVTHSVNVTVSSGGIPHIVLVL